MARFHLCRVFIGYSMYYWKTLHDSTRHGPTRSDGGSTRISESPTSTKKVGKFSRIRSLTDHGLANGTSTTSTETLKTLHSRSRIRAFSFSPDDLFILSLGGRVGIDFFCLSSWCTNWWGNKPSLAPRTRFYFCVGCSWGIY